MGIRSRIYHPVTLPLGRKKIQFSQKVDTPHLLEVRREKAMIDKHKQTKETRKKECLGVAMVLGFT